MLSYWTELLRCILRIRVSSEPCDVRVVSWQFMHGAYLARRQRDVEASANGGDDNCPFCFGHVLWGVKRSHDTHETNSVSTAAVLASIGCCSCCQHS